MFSFVPFYLTGFLGNNSRGVVEQWVNYKIKGQAYGEQSMGSLLLAAGTQVELLLMELTTEYLTFISSGNEIQFAQLQNHGSSTKRRGKWTSDRYFDSSRRDH